MDITAVTALFADLTQVELVTWVERGWVCPGRRETRRWSSARSTSPACG